MEKKYKAIVIDDERLARKELTSMMESFEQFEIVAEAEDVPTALEAINKFEPDVIFLDIQMPGQSGFDLLDQINFDGKIIFVTAYDEYAMRAFEVNALDYLLKPISTERLNKAIEKIEKDIEPVEIDSKKLTYDDRLFIAFGNHMRFLKISSIIKITASSDYSNVLTSEDKEGLILKSMNEWEERLPENYFCRIHRSTIVNLEHVEKIEKWFNYSYRVYLKDHEEPLIMSRRYAKKLKDKMG